MDAATPNRFTIVDTMLIRDAQTGLEWGPTLPDRLTLADAKAACEAYQFEGKGGFRLPTIDELETLRDRTTYEPATFPEFRPNTISGFYWSSTPDASNPACAWGVHFYYGDSYFGRRYLHYWVRPVRASQ